VHPNDRRRVVRALELAELGRSLAPADDRLWTDETRHPTVIVGLDVPPDLLEQRIRARTEAMFERGVETEVAAARARRLSATASKVLGLREVGELPRAEAVEQIVVRTRRFAAYQRKWMRRVPGIVMIDGDRPAPELADAILDLGRLRERLPRPRG
jgi:tRNA dimethylallyltransferase